MRFPVGYLKLAFALAAGEGVAALLWQLAPLWPLAVFVAILTLFLGYGFAIANWQCVVVFFSAMALFFAVDMNRQRFLRDVEMSTGPVNADLTVDGGVRCHGDWISFDSEVSGTKLKVLIPSVAGKALPRIGEIRRTIGWLDRKSAANRQRRTLWVKGRIAKCEKVGETLWAPAVRMLDIVRERLSQQLANGVDDAHSVALLRTMVLGERGGMDYTDKLAFQDAGTMHVFAISGLHIGVIAILLVTLLMFTGVQVRWAGLAMMPLLWAYVLMIGLPPSAVRAALMASLYFAAPVFWRRSDSLVAWSQTFIIVHLLNPLQIADVGSLLSFTVMFWLLFYGRWAKAVALPKTMLTPGFAVAAWLAGTPIAARVFERVTPGGLLANFAVVPLASIAVVCGFIGAVVSTVCPWLGGHFNAAAAIVVEAMCMLSRAVASLPFANFMTEPWPLWMCAGWYLAMALVCWLTLHITSRRAIEL